MGQVRITKLNGDVLHTFYEANPHYNTGDFFIGSSKIEDNWKKNMYIIKAVTHFLPDDNGDFLLNVHVEEYNPSKVYDEFEKLLGGIKRKHV